MDVEDMSIESLEKYLETKKKEENGTKVFRDSSRKVTVEENGYLTVESILCGGCNLHFADSLPLLYEAVELSKKRYKG